MNCVECKEKFDSVAKRPLILPNCGHNICCQCVEVFKGQRQASFVCATDGLVYKAQENFLTNLFVLEQIKKHDQFSFQTLRKEKFQSDLIFCIDQSQTSRRKQSLFMSPMQNKDDFEMKKKLTKIVKKISQVKQIIEELQSEKILEDLKVLDNHKMGLIQQIEQHFKEEKNKLEQINEKVEDQKMFIQGQIFKFEEEVQILQQPILNFQSTHSDKQKISEVNQQIQKLQEQAQDLQNSNYEICIKQIDVSELIKIKQNSNLYEEKQKEESLLLQETFRNLEEDQETKFKPMNLEFSPREEFHLIKSPSTNILATPSRNFLHNKSPFKKRLNFDNPFDNIDNQKRFQSGRSLNNKSACSLLDFQDQKNILKVRDTFQPEVQKIQLQRKNSFMDLGSTKKNSNNKKNKSYLHILNDKENSTAKNLNKSPQKKPDGIKNILKQIQNNKIDLNLKNMNLNDQDVKYICLKISQMQNLTTLNVSKNNITDIGLKTLLKAIKNKKIENIFLEQNLLRDPSIDYLISFKKYNQDLKKISLKANGIARTENKITNKIKILRKKGLNILI